MWCLTNVCSSSPGDSAAAAFKELNKLSRVFKDQVAYPLITAARHGNASASTSVSTGVNVALSNQTQAGSDLVGERDFMILSLEFKAPWLPVT